MEASLKRRGFKSKIWAFVLGVTVFLCPISVQSEPSQAVLLEPIRIQIPDKKTPEVTVSIQPEPEQLMEVEAGEAPIDKEIASPPRFVADRNDSISDDALGFQDCLSIATNNYSPLVIANEQINLSKMKVNEARRALYPQAKAQYNYSEGAIHEEPVEFKELSYGLQVEQPVYYGGRLKLTLKQAEVNKRIAEEKYKETEHEVAAKITEKFYSLAAAQLDFEDQKELIKQANILLSLARKRYEIDLSTQLEILNVQTQVRQVEYQLAVAERELSMARVALLQAMDAEGAMDIDIAFGMDFEQRQIGLDDSLNLAMESRPEILVHELLSKSSAIEEAIAKSKDKFKVDLTGFLGESGGAFKTEDLEPDEDWYVGLKVSKPFGKNSTSYSFTQNETSPKLGQTTRTSSTSHAFELGIFDSLAGISEKQSAFIGRLKAENEFRELQKNIDMEVRQAHHDYEKALLQIRNTSEKIAFRQEAVKIAEAEAALNEVLLSQVLDAQIKLADEKALFHQAIASYKTAIANLNKAIGIIGYFD